MTKKRSQPKAAQTSLSGKSERPDLFRYHDYREFLVDWFAYLKSSQKRFSLRSLARAAGVASGYLPMVLSGKRSLSSNNLAKLSKHLALSASERSFLESLRALAETDSPEVRRDALERIQRFEGYRDRNQAEVEVYRYLTHWYYVAIREMANLPDFVADPHWIQERLTMHVPLAEVEAALGFLLENGYLSKGESGQVKPTQKRLNCSGGVFRVALSQFHREILDLAGKSIETVPSAERSLTGHTIALSEEGFAQARAILDETIERIAKLPKAGEEAKRIYHFELLGVPLSGKAPKEGE